MTYDIYTPEPNQLDVSRVQLSDRLIGLDFEYTGTGLYSPDAKLRLAQFSDGYNVVVLDMFDAHQREFARGILNDISLTFVAYNASGAEIPAASLSLGVDISRNVLDAYTLQKLLHPELKNGNGLKEVALRNDIDHAEELVALDEALHDKFRLIYKRDVDKRKGTKAQIEAYGWTNIPQRDETYLKYAGLDALVVRRLVDVLMHEIEVRQLTTPASFEMKVNGVAARMSLRGTHISRDAMDAVRLNQGVVHAEASKRYLELSGHVPGSHKLKAKYLADQGIKFKVWNTDANGKRTGPKLGHEEIRELLITYPRNVALETLLEVSESWNVVTFTNQVEEHADSDDLIHANINTLGARSGRWTVTKPGQQTASNTSGARSLIIPPSDGHVIVGADLGQIEPRIAFTLAKATKLVNLMIRGVDAYSAITTLIFKIDSSHRDWASRRKKIKRIVLGALYAAGVDTLLFQAIYTDKWEDATREDIVEGRNAFRESAPEVLQWGKWLEKKSAVWLPSGRFDLTEPGFEYKNINKMCQGAARDVIMTRAVAASDAGLDDQLFMILHDELQLYAERSELKDMYATLKDVMEVGFMGTPTPTDVEVYETSWDNMPQLVSASGVGDTSWREW